MSARADRHQAAIIDHYALLGVGRTADLPELRRAFRLLALRHHPDRAGPESTDAFQRIAEAYATLCDPKARARHDDRLRSVDTVDTHKARPPAASAATEHGEFEGPGGRIGWRRQRAGAARGPGSAKGELDDGLGAFLPRLSGALDALLAAGVARNLADLAIELWLLDHEAATGGVAAIDAVVAVVCPTCSGIAEAGVLWCRRCDYAGSVMEQVTFTLVVPSNVRDGLTFSFETDPSHRHPPLRIRLRHQRTLADGER